MAHYGSRKDFIIRHLGTRYSPCTIMDIGCVGEGAVGFLHAAIKENLRSGDKLIGIDKDKRINDFSSNSGITYKNCSIFDQEFEQFNNQIDIVVMAEVFEHLPTPYLALHRVLALLKKDGLFIMTYPNPLSFKIFLRYLLQTDITNKTFLDRYAGASDHKIFPMPPCMIKYLKDELKCQVIELSYLKSYLSKFPILNKFSHYIGLCVRR